MKNRKKQRRGRSHAPRWALVVVLLSFCLIIYGGVQGALGVMNLWLDGLPEVTDSDKFNYAEKAKIYASDGTTLLAEPFLENREPVTLEQISPYVLHGTVATEDVRFYEHNGVDPQGIARALFNNLTGSSIEGASTITQQFVRNTLLAEEATEISFKRKIREGQLAINLEEVYSKDEILLMYLNTINYGDGSYGIEAAAKNYFQKSAVDLTLAEAATLVGIPQSPSYLNPKENPDACLERRNLVLSRMLEAGSITSEEYDAAVVEDLNLNPAPATAEDGLNIYKYPHFTSHVIKLLQNEYSTTGDVFKDGLTVYTTIDPRTQDIADEVCAEEVAELESDMDASLTAVDPDTGFILAMVGGKDYYENEWNIATQGGRQAGSTFKTFTLVTAIEQGIDPKTLIDCTSPATFGDWPVSGPSYGIRSIQGATAVSSNTGFARLVQEVTPSAVASTAEKMGITSPLTVVNSLTLGTSDVNSLEMAGAYATLASGGIQRDTTAITKILDRNDEVIYEHNDAPTRVLSEETSYATTNVLKTVYTEGTARNAQLHSGQVAAGKTGTSENAADHWLVGYTPQLSCATWIGVPKSNRATSDSINCTSLWRNFMSRALEGQDIEDFPTAENPPYESAFNKSQAQALGGDTKDEKEEETDQPVDDTILDPNNAPNTVGKTLDEAIELLAGYSAEKVEEYSDTVPAGSVIGQEVVNGKVRVHVSKGPAPVQEPEPPDDTKSKEETKSAEETKTSNETKSSGETKPG